MTKEEKAKKILKAISYNSFGPMAAELLRRKDKEIERLQGDITNLQQENDELKKVNDQFLDLSLTKAPATCTDDMSRMCWVELYAKAQELVTEVESLKQENIALRISLDSETKVDFRKFTGSHGAHHITATEVREPTDAAIEEARRQVDAVFFGGTAEQKVEELKKSHSAFSEHFHDDTFQQALREAATQALTAQAFCARAIELMQQRGKDYDKGQERSMGKTVEIFNLYTGKGLTEAEGWLMQQILKDVRQWQTPNFHRDSAEDCVAYAALKAEALAR